MNFCGRFDKSVGCTLLTKGFCKCVSGRIYTKIAYQAITWKIYYTLDIYLWIIFLIFTLFFKIFVGEKSFMGTLIKHCQALDTHHSHPNSSFYEKVDEFNFTL